MSKRAIGFVISSSVVLFGFRTDYPEATKRWSYEGQLSADAPVGQDEKSCGEPNFYTAALTKGTVEQFSDGTYHLLGFGCTTPAIQDGSPAATACSDEPFMEGLPRFVIRRFELVDDQLTVEGDELLDDKKFCFYLNATATPYDE